MVTPILAQDLETTRTIVLKYVQDRRAKVYLFGSQATGRSRLHSDIDVAILPLEPLPALIFSNIREALEESNIVRTVDVVDLSDADETLRQRVLEEGVLWKE
jgi:predicted nucleotidyltransferase